MSKSRTNRGFFAVAVAVCFGILALVGAAAWQRGGVRVYEVSPTESLLLLRTGDILDESVDLSAGSFEERVEKRIEGIDRAELHYAFSIPGKGITIRCRAIEFSDASVAAVELNRLVDEFADGTQLPPKVMGSPGIEPAIPVEWVATDVGTPSEQTLSWGRHDTYVYVVETRGPVLLDERLHDAMVSRLSLLDRPGYILPSRTFSLAQ